MSEVNQDYYRFVFEPAPDEIALAHLYELGFESFEEKEFSMEGYFPATALIETTQAEIQKISPFSKVELVKQENWNAIWESSFEPIFIENTVCVRASFHPESHLPFDIIIDPKMAFGTGHHATTYLVIGELLRLDLKEKQVMDFGCGSGILAILAEKLGSQSITAIDYDIWSVENTIENASLNQCHRIEVLQADSLIGQESGYYDLVIANITRDVLFQNSADVERLMKTGGKAIFSGFLLQDLELMKQHIKASGFQELQVADREGWCVISFTKP